MPQPVLTVGTSAFTLENPQLNGSPAVYRLVDATKPINQWQEIRALINVRGKRVRAGMTLGVPFVNALGIVEVATLKIEYQFPAWLSQTQRAIVTAQGVNLATKARDSAVALTQNPSD